jgi:hypothetical protein
MDENNENLNQDSQCPCWASNQAPPEFNTEVLEDELTCSVSVVPETFRFYDYNGDDDLYLLKYNEKCPHGTISVN